MRNFFWGLVFGAFAMYYYHYHWSEIVAAKQSLDTWRDGAVDSTSNYGPGHPKR
jgi:hypothetical protein